jgi:hypothetical protein
MSTHWPRPVLSPENKGRSGLDITRHGLLPGDDGAADYPAPLWTLPHLSAIAFSGQIS